jgi:hypothetical protein
VKPFCQVRGDFLGGDLPVESEAWPGVQVDQKDPAVSGGDRVASEDLEPESSGGVPDGGLQFVRVEGMVRESLIAVVEPFKPGQRRAGAFDPANAVELDEISGHVALKNGLFDSSGGKRASWSPSSSSVLTIETVLGGVEW